MVYDVAHDIYLPVYYVLVDSKMEITYRLILNEIKESLNQTLHIDKLHCDFEKGLLNAVTHEFPKAKIIGTVFIVEK